MEVEVREENGGPVFFGARYKLPVFEGSFGEFIAPFLEKNPDDMGHINAATGESMTNNEMALLTWRICGGLKELGVAAGDIVVLSGENSFRNAAVAYACLLLNAPLAPIDPNLKPYELKNILTNYKPRYVFCNEAQAEDISTVLTDLNNDAPILLFDKDESEKGRFTGFSFLMTREATRVVPTGVSDPVQDIALVVPSSGSTGLPKGVAISHRSLVFAVSKMLQYAWSQKGEKSLQSSHLFWISGIFSMLGALVMAQCRVFLPELKTDLIIATIQKFKPMGAFLSPSELTTILKTPDLDPYILSPLKMIGTGGGSITPFIVETFKEKLLSPPMLLHAYGMTENAGSVTKVLLDADIMSVGIPDTECDIKIVDPATERTVKKGEIGEIRVRSKYQFHSYLGNPEATKAAFDEQGFLRTGDLGYFSPDCLLFITGRLKNLIKYRNMQISPEEIENLIIEMAGVADVGVDGVPDAEDQYHAVAAVVKSPGSALTEQEIADYVKENMSQHNWLRGGVFFVDEIPRTWHMKTKRVQLKKLINELKESSKCK